MADPVLILAIDEEAWLCINERDYTKSPEAAGVFERAHARRIVDAFPGGRNERIVEIADVLKAEAFGQGTLGGWLAVNLARAETEEMRAELAALRIQTRQLLDAIETERTRHAELLDILGSVTLRRSSDLTTWRVEYQIADDAIRLARDPERALRQLAAHMRRSIEKRIGELRAEVLDG